ncbi:hypothetical protein MIR68_004979 [Amoeboaphelidium protococcarum]|nr:hypothetical protein MIR68_004979 [Amoeboaphelidium protococcarum]
MLNNTINKTIKSIPQLNPLQTTINRTLSTLPQISSPRTAPPVSNRSAQTLIKTIRVIPQLSLAQSQSSMSMIPQMASASRVTSPAWFERVHHFERVLKQRPASRSFNFE